MFPPLGVLKLSLEQHEENWSTGTTLRNYKGEVLRMFSTNVGIRDANEGEVLAILEALFIFKTIHVHLMVESDSSKF